MYQFSERSEKNLEGVHPELDFVVREALRLGVMDFSVVEGVRSLERQKKLVSTGKSWTMRSKHLMQSDGYGHAVDLYPYPVDMYRVNNADCKEIARFGILAGIILSVAKSHKIIVISGMDWDGDGQTLDHPTFDAPHFQIVTR